MAMLNNQMVISQFHAIEYVWLFIYIYISIYIYIYQYIYMCDQWYVCVYFHSWSWIMSNPIRSQFLDLFVSTVWIPLKSHWMINSDANWLVVWNIFCFSIILGISSSQLTNSIIFQRGWLNHQPEFLVSYWTWPFLVDFPIKSCDFP